MIQSVFAVHTNTYLHVDYSDSVFKLLLNHVISLWHNIHSLSFILIVT
jgi:hypothetical protein